MSGGQRRGFVRDNGLTLFFGLLFVLALVGQVVSGVALYNAQAVADGVDRISTAQYLLSSDFAVDVAENWQSEYLQFFLYVFATVWLVQRGSPESKEPGKEGTESDEDQRVGEHARAGSPRWARSRGWRLALFSRSLGIVMGAFFLASWAAQSVAGRAAYDEQQLRQLQEPVSWVGYLGTADFWNRTMQNWQSEFLAVASMCALSIYLRQRGSPESKPVGAAHTDTGVEG
ncbi:DUF6766 family protein [Kineococcus glutinatus]|uniref:DUF4328 domain-containing protein n=1 Tax=Kineococcus glutinatus TaxID=1070872 RepID=A0ABP9I740_9ACTN